MFEQIASFFTTPVTFGETTLFFAPLDLLLRVILPLLGTFILYNIIMIVIKKLILRPEQPVSEMKERVVKIIKRLLRVLLFIGFVMIIVAFLGEEFFNYVKGFWRILATPFYSSGSTRISIITVFLTIPIFFLASFISKRIKRVLDRSLFTNLSIDESTKFSVSKLIRYGFFIISLILGLSIIGIDLSSLAVLFGVLGIGVGFGLQGIVSNFFSGLVIFFERPVKEGDRIIVNNIEGKVLQIRMLSTVVDTLTNETIIVPNSQLIANSIHNYSYKDPIIIIVNRVQVSYETDLEYTGKVLLALAAQNPFAISKPTAEYRVVDFQDSGILVELRTWIRHAKNKYEAMAWTNLEIWKQFKAANIRIPFPQLDLHIKEEKHIEGKSDSLQPMIEENGKEKES
ncbi:MAG: mechanosensitive ion channel [Spirochaetales bacterium]|nr:mechanosensitive ion channel [Spirochaetales bacterium]